MLARSHRLTSPAQYRSVLKTGKRKGSPLLVLHMAIPETSELEPTRVGFVVSKAVGSAVVRNRVKRRLREILRSRLAKVPTGAQVVVRAQPAAAAASYSELESTLDRLLVAV